MQSFGTSITYTSRSQIPLCSGFGSLEEGRNLLMKVVSRLKSPLPSEDDHATMGTWMKLQEVVELLGLL